MTGTPDRLARLNDAQRRAATTVDGPLQEAIVLKLAGAHTNLCVVGDDDQGLYRLRGATIRNILEFPNQVAGECAKVELTTNYRSHPGIIDFCDWMTDLTWSQGGRSFRHYKSISPREDQFWPGMSVGCQRCARRVLWT